MPTDFLGRCDAIEECYEFMLAYAGQGLPSDAGSEAGSQIRAFLKRTAQALNGLGARCVDTLSNDGVGPLRSYESFLGVLDRDARDSLAAIEVVLAQPSISSQLIDNLNASIHLRALLTDLFLLGEVVRSRRRTAITVSQV